MPEGHFVSSLSTMIDVREVVVVSASEINCWQKDGEPTGMPRMQRLLHSSCGEPLLVEYFCIAARSCYGRRRRGVGRKIC